MAVPKNLRLTFVTPERPPVHQDVERLQQVVLEADFEHARLALLKALTRLQLVQHQSGMRA